MDKGVFCLFQGVGLLRGVGVLLGMLEVPLYNLCDKVADEISAKFRKATVHSELSTRDAHVASMDYH